MDGRARDAYHPWKIIMCCQGRKWLSHLTHHSESCQRRLSSCFISPKLKHFSYWNHLSCVLSIPPVSSLSLKISEPQSAGFSAEPPTRPFPLHLGVWLPKQMGLRGEERLKVKQQPKRSSTPSLSLSIVQGIPTDETTIDLCMTPQMRSQGDVCFKCPFSSLSNLHTIRHLPSISLERTSGQVVHTWRVKSVNSALPSWMDAYIEHSNYN